MKMNEKRKKLRYSRRISDYNKYTTNIGGKKRPKNRRKKGKRGQKYGKRKSREKAAQLSLVLGRAEGIKLKNQRVGSLCQARLRGCLVEIIPSLIPEKVRGTSPFLPPSPSLFPSIKKTGMGLRPSDATSWRGRSRMTPSSGFHGRKEGRKVRFLSPR